MHSLVAVASFSSVSEELEDDEFVEACEYIASPGPPPDGRILAILYTYTVRLYGV